MHCGPKISPPPLVRTVPSGKLERPEKHAQDAQVVPKQLLPVRGRKRSDKTLKRRSLPSLLQDRCGDQWPDVQDRLRGVKGLVISSNSIVASPSRLDNPGALGAFAEAIGVLVNADHLEAAWTLISMWSPQMRLALLRTCSAQHVTTLTSSPKPEVRVAKDRALSAASRGVPYADCIELLSLCSPEARHGVILPPLTEDIVNTLLDDATLISAVRLTLEARRTLDMKHCLAEIHTLLSIATNLGPYNAPRALAMQCVIRHALDSIAESVAGADDDAHFSESLDVLQRMAAFPLLTPALLALVSSDLQPEVLRLAVEQAANSQDGAGGLEQLASLYAVIDPALAKVLKSAITDALDQLTAEEVSGEDRTRIRTMMTDPRSLAEFAQAIDAGDLWTAAGLIRDSEDPTFRILPEVAGRLSHAIEKKLGKVGIDLWGRKVVDKKPVDKKTRASVVQEMAILLLTTGEPFAMERAAALFSMIDSHLVEKNAGNEFHASLVHALPGLCDVQRAYWLELILRSDQARGLVLQAAIDYVKSGGSVAAVAPLSSALLEALGTEGDSLQARMAYALPELCSAHPSLELDFILMTNEGKQLVTEAFNAILKERPYDAMVASLLQALVHRVDLWERIDVRFAEPAWKKAANAVAAHSQIGQLSALEAAIKSISNIKTPDLGVHEFANAILRFHIPKTGKPLFPVGSFDLLRIILTQDTSNDDLHNPFGEFFLKRSPDERKRWIEAVTPVLESLAPRAAKIAAMTLVVVAHVQPSETDADTWAVLYRTHIS